MRGEYRRSNLKNKIPSLREVALWATSWQSIFRFCDYLSFSREALVRSEES
ncbi:hypothetical protein [Helicobacter sp. 23-1045]